MTPTAYDVLGNALGLVGVVLLTAPAIAAVRIGAKAQEIADFIGGIRSATIDSDLRHLSKAYGARKDIWRRWHSICLYLGLLSAALGYAVLVWKDLFANALPYRT